MGKRATLSICVTFGLLTACGRQPAPQPHVMNDIEEMHADVEAVKQNPSVADPGKYAGPPIHVNLTAGSGGAAHQHMTK